MTVGRGEAEQDVSAMGRGGGNGDGMRIGRRTQHGNPLLSPSTATLPIKMSQVSVGSTSQGLAVRGLGMICS